MDRAWGAQRRDHFGALGGRSRISTPVPQQIIPRPSPVIRVAECDDPITWGIVNSSGSTMGGSSFFVSTFPSGATTFTQDWDNVTPVSGPPVEAVRLTVGIRSGDLDDLGSPSDYTVSGLGLTWSAPRGDNVSSARESTMVWFADGVGTPSVGTITVTKTGGSAPANDWDVIILPTWYNHIGLPLDPDDGSGEVVTGGNPVGATIVRATDGICDGAFVCSSSVGPHPGGAGQLMAPLAVNIAPPPSYSTGRSILFPFPTGAPTSWWQISATWCRMDPGITPTFTLEGFAVVPDPFIPDAQILAAYELREP